MFRAKCIALAYCDLCSQLHRLDKKTNAEDVCEECYGNDSPI